MENLYTESEVKYLINKYLNDEDNEDFEITKWFEDNLKKPITMTSFGFTRKLPKSNKPNAQHPDEITPVEVKPLGEPTND